LDGCATKKNHFFPSARQETSRPFQLYSEEIPDKGSSAELQMEAILGITYSVNVITQKGTQHLFSYPRAPGNYLVMCFRYQILH